jgi:hypothetical protein
MKKTVLTLLALSATLSVFAQGTVILNNRVTGTIVTHVYGPELGNAGLRKTGNTAAGNTQPGTQVYTGQLLTGSGYRAQLFGAAGANVDEGLLQAATPVTTFRTGTAAGQFAQVTAVLSGVAADAPLATLQLRVWDNTSGLYNDWAAASVAWNAGLIAAGFSPTWNQNAIGGQANPAPNLINSTDSAQALKTFNIYLVPEPSTFMLAGLGAASLLIFRRRK